MIGQIDEVVDNIFGQFPADIKERIDQRKSVIAANPRPSRRRTKSGLRSTSTSFSAGREG